jgi:hypothetical protein
LRSVIDVAYQSRIYVQGRVNQFHNEAGEAAPEHEINGPKAHPFLNCTG